MSINSDNENITNVLITLQKSLNERKIQFQKGDNNHLKSLKPSYVRQLFEGGIDKIGKKIGEESTETVMAAKDYCSFQDNNTKQHLVEEIADLWFHSLVMLTFCDGHIEQVLIEIEKRLGKSGIVEKLNRQ